MKNFRSIIQTISRQPARQAFAVGGVATNQEQAKSFEEVPGPKGIHLWPVLGPILMYKPFTKFTSENNQLLFDSLIDKYGPVVKLRLSELSVLISDPKDIERVFQNEGQYPTNPSMSILKTYEARNGLKPSLSSSNGEQWQRLRSPVNRRLMRPNSATYYLESHNNVADDFVQLLISQEWKAEDQIDLLFRFAAENTGVVVFNTRLGLLNLGSKNKEEVELLQQTRELFNALQKTFNGESIAHSLYRNKTYLEFEKAFNTIKSYIQKHLDKAKETVEQRKKDNPEVDSDELNLLLSLASEKNLDKDDIRGILETFYTGGSDSVAKSIQCLFYNLAHNPTKQDTLRQEIIRVLGHDTLVTAEALSKMPYLKACIKESFRLIFPTTLGPTRILNTEVVLSGYRIPAGIPIFQAYFRACKHNFSQSDQYIPERWLRSNDGQYNEQIPLIASNPFGHGARQCAGKRLALQMISLATIKVLQKTRIELPPESRNMEFIYKTFVEPKRPLQFTYRKLD
ncbi:probable cytochrome P450 12a5, mitochondrial [Biomphalaria glabrata]|uniref:Probable cytochrome P450 12a5, mitochondrial n=1 Tax=Biomphalaria glabrata TaxID=6526 RepID=A0A9W3B2I9_BIOGL|nr:probable cytochrome P450 12a5, mitochondrial [Biomphalaria glabrata]XP_055893681.1 probable cytochrome P450 12a5, mitochondrial [Biomphalaria glabrata]XP_055893682.1 probable cytochrome P450 12a5, mitochondrial [Biomphalaria glabrata]XP_055893683.1 probable cytochrome P450 12a5, mitochondrial [Biomphalaria glabrata]XP_055893684.1 probable cytochrome P450 12a5, mitochondrial [Biomphalaria glabrata]XP_055893685.1 probable cytochrome P450 12a5, mitochondrial [Biomphalaria glabrata]XP_05589368